jgi:hypothetical protein
VDLDFDITGQFDTLTITSRGHLDDVISPRQPSIDLRIEGPEIDHVTDMLGLSSLGSGTLDLDGSLKPAGDGLAAHIEGNLGRYRVSADGAFSDLADLDELDFDAQIEGPNLGRVTEWFGLSGIPQDPFDLSGKVALSQRALTIDQVTLNIGGAQFSLDGTLANFPELSGANLNLKVGGEDLERFRTLFGLPGAASGRFEITGALKVLPEGKELIDVNLKTEIAELRINGTITEPPAFVGSHLKYTGHGPNLQVFGNTYGYPSLIPEPFNIDGKIEVATDKLITEEMVRVTVGNNRLTLDGTIGFDPLEIGTSVQIHARGSSLAEIAGMAGLNKNVPHQAYDIDGHVEIVATGFRIENLHGSVGDTQITADGTISKSAGFSGSTIEASISGPDIAPWVAGIEDLSQVEGPFEASGKFELASDEVRLGQVELKAGGAEASLDAVIALPLDFSDTKNSKGEFDLTAHAPDLSAVLPKTEIYQPDASRATVQARGKWRRGLWIFESARITLADATLSMRGEVDQPPDWSSTHLQLDVAIASLANLGLINGQRLPATNLEFTGEFSGTPDMFKMDNLSGKLSDGDFTGRLAFVTGTEPPEIDIDIDANRIDLSPFLAQDDEPDHEENELELPDISEPLVEEAEDQITLQAAKSNDDGLVIPDWPLPLDLLTQFDGDVVIDARVVQLVEIALHDFALHAAVHKGALTVDRFAARGQDGTIAAALSIAPDNGSAKVALTFEGTDLYGRILPDLSDEEAAQAPRYAADVNLTGQGLTLREVASSLDGRIKLTSDGGLIRNQGGGLLYGSFFEELLVAVNPFRGKETYTEMVCAVFFVDVQDGIASANPSLVIQTDKMNIISKGTLDLTTEKIGFKINTGARKGIGISAADFINPFIKVGGTLANPRIALDAPTAAVTTGAAVVTLGISMLATAATKRIFRKKDPCGAALAEAEKRHAEKGNSAK